MVGVHDAYFAGSWCGRNSYFSEHFCQLPIDWTFLSVFREPQTLPQHQQTKFKFLQTATMHMRWSQKKGNPTTCITWNSIHIRHLQTTWCLRLPGTRGSNNDIQHICDVLLYFRHLLFSVSSSTITIITPSRPHLIFVNNGNGCEIIEISSTVLLSRDGWALIYTGTGAALPSSPLWLREERSERLFSHNNGIN